MLKSLFLKFATWLLLPGLKPFRRIKNRNKSIDRSSTTASTGRRAERSGCERSSEGGCNGK